jgi:hypothetical protein
MHVSALATTELGFAATPVKRRRAMRTVVGLFDNISEAQRTLQELVQLGFAPENISIITNPKSQPGFASGMRLNLSAIDLNDVGRVAAAGPMREALKSENGGANLSATLRRYGFTNDIANHYAAGVRQGETLESIVVEDRDSDKVVEIMRRHSHVPAAGYESQQPTTSRPAAAAATAAAGTTSVVERAKEKIETLREERGRDRDRDRRYEEEERTIPVIREELHVGKREVERGAVRASVHVVERPVSGEVKIREEHVEVERRAVDRPLGENEKLFRDDQVEMREYAEEPVSVKEARVVEEVILHKTVKEHIERIEDRVRSTEVEFDRPYDASTFRKHFDTLGLKGARFEEYSPAYRLGYDLRRDPRMKGARWEDIEPRVRENWEAKSPGTWERFKESIKHAFSR